MAQATGRWGELINMANAWLPEQTDNKQKIRLCLRLGKWYGEDLGHPEYAQPYYQQIMALDPNNVQVLRQMAAIHRMGAHWQKVGETLTRALDVAVANEDRKAILVDLGELLFKNMGQPDQGIAFYKRALEVDPLYVPALTALERIYEERSNHNDLVDILSSKVKALSEPEQVASTKLRMAGLYESTLGDFDRGGKVYREVLEIDGGNLVALRGLERIYNTTQQWAELVSVLERQLDVVATERERVEVLLRLAGIQEEHFLKFDVAATRLEQALEISPGEERAYIALERCYRRLKQWLDLINTYERHISEAATSSTKVELYGLIAAVQAQEVGDVDRAIDAYRNIVDIDDSNVPALEALSKLYEKQGDAAQSIEAMTRVADLTSDGNQRVEMYYRIGKALEDKLGDRGQAQERFEMSLDLDPAHLPTLAALRTIAIDESDWDRAARYLEQEQLNTPTPRARAKLLVELGKLRDDMLSEHELAVQAYELAMQCDADCEEAALPLLQEYIRVERFADAEPLAEMLVRKSKNKERTEQHTLYKLLGKVHAALGNNDKALKALHHGQPARSDGSGDHSRHRRRGLPVEGLAERADQLSEGADRAGRGRHRAAHGRLLPTRSDQARAGPGQASHQQLREGARPERRASPDPGSASRDLRPEQRLEASRRLQAPDLGQRLRRRRAIQDPERDRRHLERAREESPKGDRRLGGSARPQAARSRALAQALAAVPVGRRLAEDGRHAASHRRARRQARKSRRATSSRKPKSTATRSKIWTVRSSSSTSRSI